MLVILAAVMGMFMGVLMAVFMSVRVRVSRVVCCFSLASES